MIAVFVRITNPKARLDAGILTLPPQPFSPRICRVYSIR